MFADCGIGNRSGLCYSWCSGVGIGWRSASRLLRVPAAALQLLFLLLQLLQLPILVSFYYRRRDLVRCLGKFLIVWHSTFLLK